MNEGAVDWLTWLALWLAEIHCDKLLHVCYLIFWVKPMSIGQLYLITGIDHDQWVVWSVQLIPSHFSHDSTFSLCSRYYHNFPFVLVHSVNLGFIIIINALINNHNISKNSFNLKIMDTTSFDAILSFNWTNGTSNKCSTQRKSEQVNWSRGLDSRENERGNNKIVSSKLSLMWIV